MANTPHPTDLHSLSLKDVNITIRNINNIKIMLCSHGKFKTKNTLKY